MESRKVQKVGASTLSVSLPKEWAEANGLRKGDIVLFEPLKDGTLRVMPSRVGEAERGPAQIEYVVNADLCDEVGMLGRVVVGNYVIGRNHLRIKSKSRIRSEHIQEVRSAVSKLMGLGIMMETPDEIELQCSIDAARFPMETVIKRLYTIGATMQREAIEALEKKDKSLAEDAVGREDEADMIYWLALRLLLSAQADPSLAEKIGIHDSLPIVGNRLIAKNLEHVADYADNIARNAVKILDSGRALDPAVVRRLRKTSDTSAQIVADALASIFVHDMHLANKAIEAKARVEASEEDLLREIVDASDDPAQVASLRAILWSLRRIAEYGSEIAVIGINRYLERSSALCRPVDEKEPRSRRG
ncbi:MAG TPA: phosphate uptake regulator PhoU [Candidatus Thermoplasmatota archaeon]|nr:phosphate uptake regulator PhoU [Candidatus Thermoplasmatota archaeon]